MVIIRVIVAHSVLSAHPLAKSVEVASHPPPYYLEWISGLADGDYFFHIFVFLVFSMVGYIHLPMYSLSISRSSSADVADCRSLANGI